MRHRVIHAVGSAAMLDEGMATGAAEAGYPDPLAFYFAGRGGVLGEVDAEVVSAAFGWWEPGTVRLNWDRGVAVAGAGAAARRYGELLADWGERNLGGVEGAERLVVLAERLVAAVEGAGLPLFAGWRAERPAASTRGRLAQLIFILREWRGALHLIGTTAAELSPLEAILTNEGAAQARFFGWTGELPDCSALAPRHEEAEAITDRLEARGYAKAFSAAERAEFDRLVHGLDGYSSRT